jgi:hypothetical protein
MQYFQTVWHPLTIEDAVLILNALLDVSLCIPFRKGIPTWYSYLR